MVVSRRARARTERKLPVTHFGVCTVASTTIIARMDTIDGVGVATENWCTPRNQGCFCVEAIQAILFGRLRNGMRLSHRHSSTAIPLGTLYHVGRHHSYKVHRALVVDVAIGDARSKKILTKCPTRKLPFLEKIPGPFSRATPLQGMSLAVAHSHSLDPAQRHWEHRHLDRIRHVSPEVSLLVWLYTQCRSWLGSTRCLTDATCAFCGGRCRQAICGICAAGDGATAWTVKFMTGQTLTLADLCLFAFCT